MESLHQSLGALVRVSLTLQDLPQENLLKVLTFLDVEDLISFSSLNRYFRDVYQKATLIVYRAALLEAGMIDVSDSSTSLSFTIPAKLALLKQRREAWRTLQMLYQYDASEKRNVAQALRVRLNFKPSSLYDFSSGVYVLGEERTSYRDTGVVRFLDLSVVCAEGEVARKTIAERAAEGGAESQANWRTVTVHSWPLVEVGKGERIVDFGLALREHDLIALITEARSADGSVISMHLRQLSTGQPHPFAKTPIIPVQTRPRSGSLAIMLEVSGPNLVLLLTSSSRSGGERSHDWLAVYNWYTGEQITSTTSRPGTWQGFVFLTEKLIILPNAHNATLDIVKIPGHSSPEKIAVPTGNMSSTDMFTKLLSLHLPRPLPGFSITSVVSRSEPNPFGIPHPDAAKIRLSLRRGEDAYITLPQGERRHYIKGTPLISAPESAIILIRFYMEEQLTMRQAVHTLFVHRSSILNVLNERKDAVRQAVPGHIGVEALPAGRNVGPVLGVHIPGADEPLFLPLHEAMAANINIQNLLPQQLQFLIGGAVDEAEVEEQDEEVIMDENNGGDGDGEDDVEMAMDENGDGNDGEDVVQDMDVGTDESEDEISDEGEDEGEGEEVDEDEGEEGEDANADEDVQVQAGIPLHGQIIAEVNRQLTGLRQRQAEALAKSADESTNGGPASASTSREVSWSAWGPENTRWVPERLARSQWVTTTCGQRAVLEDDSQIIVWDFNPYAVRRERYRAHERRDKEAKRRADRGNNEIADGVRMEHVGGDEEVQEQTVEREVDQIEEVAIFVVDTPTELRSRRPVFCVPIVSKLPYVGAITPISRNYRFARGEMLDEDHIVGISPRLETSAVDVFAVK